MSLTPAPGESKKRVCYFFDSDIGNYHYGPGHPMKPTRIRMCHSLVMNYGLYNKMEIFRAKPATKREMSQFHTDDYVDFLARITPENMNLFAKEQVKYNVGDDCPVFDGLFEYCSISAGGSMEGAARLSRDKCDIAINWAGGLHHAKKAEASGFCYINDIVLGILELLRYHKRVLYIDIDVHHGDGVEEAFYTTDRVMTVSLHKYGEFFPGTGGVRDRGIGGGKGYSVNVPLHDGINDASYASIFQPVIQRVVEWYQPCAIVLQCGSDSLSGDKLGGFNLSMKGHAECVKFVKSFGLPLLLLGGGGYTMRNVARAWCYETGLAAGVELGHKLPINEYFSYFGPDYELDVQSSNMDDLNTPEYLQKLKSSIFDQMRDKSASPSVQIHQTPVMPHDEMDDAEFEDEEDPNDRKIRRLMDQRIAPETELSDSEDESAPTSAPRRDRRSHRSEGPVSIMNGLHDVKGKSRATVSPPRSTSSPKIHLTTDNTTDAINISSTHDSNNDNDVNSTQPDISSYSSSVIPIPVLEPANPIQTPDKVDGPVSSVETLPQEPTQPVPSAAESATHVSDSITTTNSIAADTPITSSASISAPTPAPTSAPAPAPAPTSAPAPAPAPVSDQIPTSEPAPISSSVVEESARPLVAQDQSESSVIPVGIDAEDPPSAVPAVEATTTPVVISAQPTTVEPVAELEPKPETQSESEAKTEPRIGLISENAAASNRNESHTVPPERVPTSDETMTGVVAITEKGTAGVNENVGARAVTNATGDLNGMEDGELEEGELRQEGDRDGDIEMA